MTVRDLTPDSSRSAGDFSAIRPQVAAKCMHAALWRFAKTLLSTSAMQGLRVRHALLLCAVLAHSAYAQYSLGPDETPRIEAVQFQVSNPGQDAYSVERAIDRLRKAMSIFPGDRVSQEKLDFELARLRSNPNVSAAEFDVQRGATGGVVVQVDVELAANAAPDRSRPAGALVKDSSQGFPLLYQDSQSFLRVKLETLGLYYGNRNAWYGRPDHFLAGNPMVQGRPSGAGYQGWMEGYVHAGLYGLTPLSPHTYLYGSGSVMLTGSKGKELFTDRTRSNADIEEAYVGLVTGRTTEPGDRWVLHVSAGRQRFTLGDGMLIVNTAANGQDRAALQANARWASDFVGLAQLRYNQWKLEAFHVNPDELPLLDTHTRINGLNVEHAMAPGLEWGASYLTVPHSTAQYYLPDGSQRQREGLKVYDLRGRWQPNVAGQSGPFVAAEAAMQRNGRFAMKATAYTGELGYAFAQAVWKPTLSYRYSHFSGDDPGTSRYERWDPLLSGGNGEQWVQGINHFKVVQIGNVNAHRVQLRMRPHQKLELVAQYWRFKADSLLNIGGNPALSMLGSKDYGQELNLTAKVFWSRHLYIHGHIAVTDPGRAVSQALGTPGKKWWSTMVFLRYAY